MKIILYHDSFSLPIPLPFLSIRYDVSVFEIFKIGVKSRVLKAKNVVFCENRYIIPVKTIRNQQVVGSSPIASSIGKSRLLGHLSRSLFCAQNTVLSLIDSQTMSSHSTLPKFRQSKYFVAW